MGNWSTRSTETSKATPRARRRRRRATSSTSAGRRPDRDGSWSPWGQNASVDPVSSAAGSPNPPDTHQSLKTPRVVLLPVHTTRLGPFALVCLLMEYWTLITGNAHACKTTLSGHFVYRGHRWQPIRISVAGIVLVVIWSWGPFWPAATSGTPHLLWLHLDLRAKLSLI